MPNRFAILVLDQLRQEDHYNFQASQGHRVRPYLKTLITKLNTKTKKCLKFFTWIWLSLRKYKIKIELCHSLVGTQSRKHLIRWLYQGVLYSVNKQRTKDQRTICTVWRLYKLPPKNSLRMLMLTHKYVLSNSHKDKAQNDKIFPRAKCSATLLSPN